MSPRELVILILGLAIVAVVLRGLYVALQARRGQIKLAIAKNIPHDIDLDALEMAELPGGGARVVERTLATVNRQNAAVNNAAALNLADQQDTPEPIPVLMDPVQLRSKKPAPAQVSSAHSASPETSEEVEPVGQHTNSPEDEPILAKAIPDYSDVELDDDDNTTNPVLEPYVSDSGEDVEDNPDSVLFDYDERAGAVDNLSQVTPDYAGDDEDADNDADDEFDPESDNDFDDDFDEDDEYGDYEDGVADDPDAVDDEDDEDEEEDDEDEDFDDDEYADDDYDEDDDEDYDEDYDPLDDDDPDDQDSDVDLNFLDDDLEDFSMTAGERIGYTKTRDKAQRQAGLFDDEDAAGMEPAKAKRKPLFAALSRRFLQKNSAPPQSAPASEPETAPDAPTEPVAESALMSAPGPEQQRDDSTETVRVMSKPKAQEVVATPAQPRVAPVTDVNAGRRSKAEPAHESTMAEPSEVVVLNVMAKSGRAIAGDDLLHVLITSGMKFGDMNIFHRRLGGDNKGPVIFSIANILNPGTFDLNTMHEFTTLGVSLFLALPTAINNLEAFEQMLTVANQIGDAFDAELRDDNRNLMTAQTIEHYRQRIRDFELRRLKAAGARG